MIWIANIKTHNQMIVVSYKNFIIINDMELLIYLHSIAIQIK